MKDLEKRVDSYLDYGYEFLGKLIKCASVLDEFKENSDAPFGIVNKKVHLIIPLHFPTLD